MKTATISFHYTSDSSFAWLTYRGKKLLTTQISGPHFPNQGVAEKWASGEDQTPGQSLREDAYRMLRREALRMGFTAVR